MTKTFSELERIGIVGTYHDNGLFIITRDACKWLYVPSEKMFHLLGKLE